MCASQNLQEKNPPVQMTSTSSARQSFVMFAPHRRELPCIMRNRGHFENETRGQDEKLLPQPAGQPIEWTAMGRTAMKTF
jgi:hypothetical protein